MPHKKSDGAGFKGKTPDFMRTLALSKEDLLPPPGKDKRDDKWLEGAPNRLAENLESRSTFTQEDIKSFVEAIANEAIAGVDFVTALNWLSSHVVNALLLEIYDQKKVLPLLGQGTFETLFNKTFSALSMQETSKFEKAMMELAANELATSSNLEKLITQEERVSLLGSLLPLKEYTIESAIESQENSQFTCAQNLAANLLAVIIRYCSGGGGRNDSDITTKLTNIRESLRVNFNPSEDGAVNAPKLRRRTLDFSTLGSILSSMAKQTLATLDDETRSTLIDKLVKASEKELENTKKVKCTKTSP